MRLIDSYKTDDMHGDTVFIKGFVGFFLFPTFANGHGFIGITSNGRIMILDHPIISGAYAMIRSSDSPEYIRGVHRVVLTEKIRPFYVPVKTVENWDIDSAKIVKS